MEFITPENFEDFITHIHDKLFKLFFQRTAVMLECLTHFCPRAVVDTLDLTQLKLKDTNFITKNLKEYFSDVIYETYLKDYPDSLQPDDSKTQQKNKKEAKVVLITDHKSSIESYLSLFLQLISYKLEVLFQDLAEGREPSIVLAIIVNHGKQPIKTKTFQDCYKFLPDALKEYVLQLKLIVVNVHDLKRDTLLKMQESSLLRSLFLTYQAVESEKEKDDILIEIFKFLLHNTNLWQYFQPILYYLMQEGQFKEASIDKTVDYYLTSQKKRKMGSTLSLGKQWIALGKAEGKAEGEVLGKVAAARLTILIGCIRGYDADIVSDLSQLPMDEIEFLRLGFETVKKAWKKKKVDVNVLVAQTQLLEKEVKYILTYLDAPPK